MSAMAASSSTADADASSIAYVGDAAASSIAYVAELSAYELVASSLAVGVCAWCAAHAHAERRAAREAAARKSKASAWERKYHCLPERPYAAAELAAYDGRDADRPILLAADGAVFNVSRGREYYGAGGCYHALAGRDSSRLLAKGRLEPESAAELTEPLRRDELETLREWRELFEFKYVRLGPLEGWTGHAPPQDAAGEQQGDEGQAALAARLAEEFGDG